MTTKTKEALPTNHLVHIALTAILSLLCIALLPDGKEFITSLTIVASAYLVSGGIMTFFKLFNGEAI